MGVERGERNLSFKRLCAIATALSRDVGSLARGSPVPDRARYNLVFFAATAAVSIAFLVRGEFSAVFSDSFLSPFAGAFRSRCPIHRKRESQRDVTDCETLRC
jgi:hypothetical protein